MKDKNTFCFEGVFVSVLAGWTYQQSFLCSVYRRMVFLQYGSSCDPAGARAWRRIYRILDTYREGCGSGYASLEQTENYKSSDNIYRKTVSGFDLMSVNADA
jgi:hypothetical protein